MLSCVELVVVEDIVLVYDDLSVLSMFLLYVFLQNVIETGTLERLLVTSGCFLFFLPCL